jgi:hypothetical protein
MAIITLTKVPQDIEQGPRDRPAAIPEAQDLVVTSEMVSAGVAVLEECLETYCHSTLAEAVYIAMKKLENCA